MIVIHRDIAGEHETEGTSCWCCPLVIVDPVLPIVVADLERSVN